MSNDATKANLAAKLAADQEQPEDIRLAATDWLTTYFTLAPEALGDGRIVGGRLERARGFTLGGDQEQPEAVATDEEQEPGFVSTDISFGTKRRCALGSADDHEVIGAKIADMTRQRAGLTDRAWLAVAELVAEVLRGHDMATPVKGAADGSSLSPGH